MFRQVGQLFISLRAKRLGSFTGGAARGVVVTRLFFLFFLHVFICSVYLSVSQSSP